MRNFSWSTYTRFRTGFKESSSSMEKLPLGVTHQGCLLNNPRLAKCRDGFSIRTLAKPCSIRSRACRVQLSSPSWAPDAQGSTQEVQLVQLNTSVWASQWGIPATASQTLFCNGSNLEPTRPRVGRTTQFIPYDTWACNLPVSQQNLPDPESSLYDGHQLEEAGMASAEQGMSHWPIE